MSCVLITALCRLGEGDLESHCLGCSEKFISILELLWHHTIPKCKLVLSRSYQECLWKLESTDPVGETSNSWVLEKLV
jgi:hypothetical protein